MHKTVSTSSKWTEIEENFKEKSNFNPSTPKDLLPLIELKNGEEIGKLSSLSFILWLAKNPKGVAVLPIGKNSLSFLSSLTHYVVHWTSPDVQEELNSLGIFMEMFPDTNNVKLVQPFIFNPPLHQYQTSLYKKLLHIADKHILSLNLEGVKPSKVENEFSTLCQHTLRQWGGIGFYLSEIGQDANIGFNAPGSKFKDITQQYQPPYSTLAQIASDFGGIDHVKGKTLLTIALGGFRSDATIIITGTGEDKALSIKDAIEKTDNSHLPISAVRKLANIRFYVTEGAASKLSSKRGEIIRTETPLSHRTIDDTLIDLALEKKKRLSDLSSNDLESDEMGRSLLSRLSDNLESTISQCRQRLIDKMGLGLSLPKKKTILHTAPHHDDIMLSYYSSIDPLLSENKNHFTYLTSGSNSVTDKFVKSRLTPKNRKTSPLSYSELINRFSKAYEGNSQEEMNLLEKKIIQQKKMELDSEEDLKPLKSFIRESEVDRLWSLKQVPQECITHFRGKFYSDIKFINEDAREFKKHIDAINPDIITLALDPEGTGPTTHHLVQRIITDSLRRFLGNPPIEIWGYRNVWFQFSCSECNLIIPVSKDALQEQNRAFLSCFPSQSKAAFPSPRHDGPFSELSEKILREQYEQIVSLLGEDFLTDHPDERIRSARGFVFIQTLSVKEIIQKVTH
ncbi:MAG: glucosamine-6-phosphate deaminase [Chlamydiales bacterium]|jgi:glucosamine-6-phosphate deaminase